MSTSTWILSGYGLAAFAWLADTVRKYEASCVCKDEASSASRAARAARICNAPRSREKSLMNLKLVFRSMVGPDAVPVP